MSFLSKLFGKKTSLPPADLSVLKVDVHSHFIPGIDDGAATLQDSLDLVRAMSELGYKKVITTPHIMSDYYRNTPEIILGGLEKVRAAIREEGIDMEIEAAAEYYLDHEFEQSIPEKNLLTFGKNYVLFELPFISEPPMMAEAIFKMQTNGYKPVLAHPERYGFYYNQYEKYQELIDKGVLLQLNINSLIGHYSPETKKISERMINDGLFSFLGSDCHHLNHAALTDAARTEKALHKLLESGKLLNDTL